MLPTNFISEHIIVTSASGNKFGLKMIDLCDRIDQATWTTFKKRVPVLKPTLVGRWSIPWGMRRLALKNMEN